jgi:chemotaxis protein MotB
MVDDEDNTSAPGAPSWRVTFADLMSLLLCFFILLLSFSTMDVIKFTAIAASLQSSLGLQAVVVDPNATVVMTTATEVAPTKVEPEPPSVETESPEPEPSSPDLLSAEQVLAAREQAETEQLATDLAQALRDEIIANRIELLAAGRTVTLRIRENGSFPSGEAELQTPVRTVLARIRDRLAATEGQIEVAGHTDNQPIETDRFRSNWELSSARAVSVAHELMQGGTIPPSRVLVSGHADTHSIASNEDEAGRARNRRVEIVIRR